MNIRVSEQINHSLARSMCRGSWPDFHQVGVLQFCFYERIDQDTSIVLHDVHSVDIRVVQIAAEFLHLMNGIFFEERDDLGEVAF